MKKLFVALSIAGLLSGGIASAVTPKECRDSNGNVVSCKHARTSGTNKNAKKATRGAKHGAYDVTHNKVTKGLKINKGNEKYRDHQK